MSTVSAVLDVDSEVPTVSKHTGTATCTVVAAVAIRDRAGRRRGRRRRGAPEAGKPYTCYGK